MTRNRLLVPLAAVVVAALLIALTYAVSARAPHSPAVLRLAGATAGTMSAELAPAAAGTAADSRSSAQSAYKLSGELPAGRPADAPVYALDGPYSTDRLASVLARAGLTTDHASWWWSSSPPCSAAAPGAPESKPGTEPAPDTPVSSDGASLPSDTGTVGCAYSSGSGSSSAGGTVTAVAPPSPDQAVTGGPVPAPGSAEPAPPCCKDPAPGCCPQPAPEPTTPAMTTAEAKAVAKPVLEAVDLSVDDAQVTVTPWGASVWVNPVVHGLPTAGYSTRIEIGQDKKISYASGFLGDLSKGDSYPLVTAQEAFDQLPAPMTAMLCRVGPNGQGCQAPPQQEVTGAVLGLSLQQTGTGDQLLVPAWLFSVKDWTDPLPQVAVEGRYLGQPEPEQTAPVGKDGGQTTPGTVVDPVPPATPNG